MKSHDPHIQNQAADQLCAEPVCPEAMARQRAQCWIEHCRWEETLYSEQMARLCLSADEIA